LRVVCLDGARRIGAKILVSGGSRCNVTNRVVTERDFWGAKPRAIRAVLRAFPADRAAAFFEELGVALHEEEDGKLFPDSNRSRTVLDALVAEACRTGVTIDVGQRVSTVHKQSEDFLIGTEAGRLFAARAVVLATGGRSLPKTGSNGFGYELAAHFGHGHVPTCPGLAPLVFDGWGRLAGVSHPATMTLRANGRAVVRLEGPLLWTHFGASGPLALNMSRHWHRAQLDGLSTEVLVSLIPGETFESLEAWFLRQQDERPRAQVATVLAGRVPVAVSDCWVGRTGIHAETTMAHLGRDERRGLTRAVLETALPVVDSRGYGYAEVTAGGVPLDEIDVATMQSRICPGLYFVGEILDVDGRLGGFNFQWAWSSAWVAGQAIARELLP
jgi:predicted Rossmann fold flavoprotein